MSVLTVDVARTHLNIPDRPDDNLTDELQSTIDEAEAALVNLVGPLVPTATTSRVEGRSYTLLLPVTPVISLTSVTPVGGAALTVTDLQVDAAGIVRYAVYPWAAFSAYWYDVAYSAGRVTVPANLIRVEKELLTRYWMTQRGPDMRYGMARAEILSNLLTELDLQRLLASDRQLPVA
jgi:hypothetical protein